MNILGLISQLIGIKTLRLTIVIVIIICYCYCSHCHFSKSSKMAKGSIFSMEITCYGKLSEVQEKLDNIVNNI